MQIIQLESRLAPLVLPCYLDVGGGGIQEILPGLRYFNGLVTRQFHDNETKRNFYYFFSSSMGPGHWLHRVKLQLEAIYTTK